MTRYLSVQQVIDLHSRRVPGVGVRDLGRIEAAVHRPASGYGGEEVYPDLFSKAGVLLHGLAATQGFVDGNKRVAWAAAVGFLRLNGVDVASATVDMAETFVLEVATGKLNAHEAGDWFAYRSRDARSPMRFLRGGEYRWADLINYRDAVVNLHATELTILGPAVIYPGPISSIGDCRFEVRGLPDAISWTLEEGRTGMVGSIALHFSHFQNCVFVDTGVAGSEAELNRFLKELRTAEPAPQPDVD